MNLTLPAPPSTEKKPHEYPSDQEIAARARDIWMSEGCSHACIGYWCRAEEELLLETTAAESRTTEPSLRPELKNRVPAPALS